MKVGIVAQRENHRATSLAEQIEGYVRSVDGIVLFDRSTAAALEDARPESVETDTRSPNAVDIPMMAECDLVVSIGGDGTFLYAAREIGSTPILGVNLGEVGFLNAVPPENAVDTVRQELAELRTDDIHETTSLIRLGSRSDDWSLPAAINDVVVHGPRRGHGGGGDFEVRIDGERYSHGHADGILVATPTGSTAYNLSENGPLVHPGVDGLIINEMAGSEGMAPLVVDAGSEITVDIRDADSGVVVADGRTSQQIEPPQRIVLTRANDPVRIAGPSRTFFEGLGKLE